MLRFLSVIGILGLFAACLSALPPDSGTQTDLAKQVVELSNKVTALEARVATLEENLRKITVRIPQQFPELKELPKGWEKRYFNGIPYYIIPIERGSEDKAKMIR